MNEEFDSDTNSSASGKSPKRKPKNLYLDQALVERGEEIVRNSKHKSLSSLVETLLIREFDRIERNNNPKEAS